MKKKLIIGFGAFAIAAIAAFNININTNNSDLSTLSLANVEALAQESSITTWNCTGSMSACNLSCGQCGTSVSGRGHSSGSHKCN